LAKVDGAAFRIHGRDYRYLVVDRPPFIHVSGLTAAEVEVTKLVCAGCSNREIARQRHTSANTVGNQLAAIFAKLSVTSRFELVEFVTRLSRRG
jgi:DNA-binding CsgD family transcriptional regulator